MQKDIQVSAMLFLSQLLYAGLQAQENKLDGLLSDLRATSMQAAPLASFGVLCNMRSMREQTHAACAAARTQHLQAALPLLPLVCCLWPLNQLKLVDGQLCMQHSTQCTMTNAWSCGNRLCKNRILLNKIPVFNIADSMCVSLQL